MTTANDMHMTGMTVLTKNEQGKVIKVFNGHRNLMEAVIFVEHFVRGQANKGIVSLFHKKALKKYGLNLKYPRNAMNIKWAADVTEKKYINAFRLAANTAFESILDCAVTLSSSYVSKTVEGINEVSSCLAIMSDLYEHCIFTSQATHENRTYLLYQGKLRNELLVSDGFLILVRNEAGKISEVLDNPIPMHAGTMISSFIAEHHPDKSFCKEYLYNGELFKQAVEKYSLNNVYGANTRDLSSYKGFIAQFLIKV